MNSICREHTKQLGTRLLLPNQTAVVERSRIAQRTGDPTDIRLFFDRKNSSDP
uniref:Uncharacterized protein n=1 Tax=Arundo donax TaxID=35708 RepID=A0A0A8YIF5_ARUDO